MSNRKTYASTVLELSFATERIFEVEKIWLLQVKITREWWYEMEEEYIKLTIRYAKTDLSDR